MIEARLDKWQRRVSAAQSRLEATEALTPATDLLTLEHPPVVETNGMAVTRWPDIADRLQYLLAAKREGHYIAVIMVGVDGMRRINETHGFTVGDRLLREIGDVTATRLTGDDFLCYVGMDKFIVVATALHNVAEAIKVAEMLRNCTQEVDELSVKGATLSAGVAYARSERPANELLLECDRALELAKRNGRNRSHVYDDRLRELARNLSYADNRVREALTDQRILNSYQPIFDLQKSRVTGFEALVQIAGAEASTVQRLDSFSTWADPSLFRAVVLTIFGNACQQMLHWRHMSDDLVVSFNITSGQTKSAQRGADLRRFLDGVSVPPERLGFEFAEPLLVDSETSAETTASSLADIGARIYINEVTGSAESIERLLRLRPHGVKLHRSLTSNLGHGWGEQLAATIIGILRNEEIETTAVGVATEDQQSKLLELGCDRVQGGLIGPPLLADAATELLKTVRL